ncbi:MAG: type IV toxin-antitoxin system AbiEi family antitoxin [Planctomycetota bacterium]
MNASPARSLPFRRGAAGRFVDSLLQKGRVAFALEELVLDTGLSPIAALRQLSRLGPAVRRVAPRQAFFLVVSPEYRALGAPSPAAWLDDYFRWLGHPWYLALQSAAAEFGSPPQAIQETQVMTDRPRRPLRLGRIRIRFFVKRSLSSTPTQPVSGAPAPLQASTPEATAVDLVRYARRIGGISAAVETLEPFAGRLLRKPLSLALDADGGIPTAQRLGFVLEALRRRDLAAFMRQRLPARLTPVPLDRALPASARWPAVNAKRWGILEGGEDASR